MNESNLKPIIKWAGGKEKELKFIIPNLPIFENYYEPFVGGGSVFAKINAKKYYINDKSSELISLYSLISDQNELFFKYIENINDFLTFTKNLILQIKLICVEKYKRLRENPSTENFNSFSEEIIFLNNKINEKREFLFPHKKNIILEIQKALINKIKRMIKLEKSFQYLSDEDIFSNIETGILGGIYNYFRFLYNTTSLEKDKTISTALFFYIRNYCYSGMFRYSNNGNFNVPYGGNGYNNKLLDTKINYYKSDALINKFTKTLIYNLDFYDFFKLLNPTENDFIFLDPPYDSDFSTYAKNPFTKDDQKRLSRYLCEECRGKWMLIIKNTPFIESLYMDYNLNIQSFDKKYTVSFMNRNNKNAEHLLITNY